MLPHVFVELWRWTPSFVYNIIHPFCTTAVIHEKTRPTLLPFCPATCFVKLVQAFIHGIENNPVAALAQELGLTLVPMDECKLLNRQGQPVPEAMDK